MLRVLSVNEEIMRKQLPISRRATAKGRRTTSYFKLIRFRKTNGVWTELEVRVRIRERRTDENTEILKNRNSWILWNFLG